VVRRRPVRELPSIAVPFAVSQAHESCQRAVFVEPIRLRTTADGVWVGGGGPDLTICGQVTADGHGFSMAITRQAAALQSRTNDCSGALTKAVALRSDFK